MIDFIIKNWANLNLIYKILIVIITVFIIGGITDSYIGDSINFIMKIKIFLKKLIPSNTNKVITQTTIIKNVTNHKMISEMNELKMEFKSLNFGDHRRNRIFEIIMYTKIDVTIKYLINFVKTNNINKLDKNEFNVLIFKMIQEILDEIDMKLKIKLGQDVYNIVISSSRGVKVWEKQNIESLLKYIKEVTNVNYIKLNSDVFNLIQSSLSVSLMVTFNSMESRFFNFNGELANVLEKNHWDK